MCDPNSQIVRRDAVVIEIPINVLFLCKCGSVLVTDLSLTRLSCSHPGQHSVLPSAEDGRPRVPSPVQL